MSLLMHTLMGQLMHHTGNFSQNAKLFDKYMCNKQVSFIPISVQTQISDLIKKPLTN